MSPFPDAQDLTVGRRRRPARFGRCRRPRTARQPTVGQPATGRPREAVRSAAVRPGHPRCSADRRGQRDGRGRPAHPGSSGAGVRTQPQRRSVRDHLRGHHPEPRDAAVSLRCTPRCRTSASARYVDHGRRLVEWVAEGSLDAAFIAIAGQMDLPKGVTSRVVGTDRLAVLSPVSCDLRSTERRHFVGRTVVTYTTDHSGEELDRRVVGLGATPHRAATAETAVRTGTIAGRPGGAPPRSPPRLLHRRRQGAGHHAVRRYPAVPGQPGADRPALEDCSAGGPPGARTFGGRLEGRRGELSALPVAGLQHGVSQPVPSHPQACSDGSSRHRKPEHLRRHRELRDRRQDLPESTTHLGKDLLDERLQPARRGRTTPGRR